MGNQKELSAMETNGVEMRKKVIIKAPILTRSGYGEQSRFALRALRTREDLYDIYIKPINWGKTSWLFERDEERVWIDQTIEKTINYLSTGGQFDMSLQITIPNEFERLAPVNIGYTAGIETNKVAPQWLIKSNEMDKIITISKHSKEVFENTAYTAENQLGQKVLVKLNTPIDFVSYPVKHFATTKQIDLDLSTNYNFLCVSQMGHRKNIFNTIKWFIEEFRNEDVGLVIKTNLAKNSIMDREASERELNSFLSSEHLRERTCKVYLLHGDMTEEEVNGIYSHPKINAFVSLTHGEGFGLPIFEAAYSGLPVITTGWSGQLDYLYDRNGRENFYNVEFDMLPVQREVVWKEVIEEGSMWAYPREQSAKSMMRKCYNEYSNDNERIAEKIEQVENYLEYLWTEFSEEKVYSDFVNAMSYEDASIDLESLL